MRNIYTAIRRHAADLDRPPNFTEDRTPGGEAGTPTRKYFSDVGRDPRTLPAVTQGRPWYQDHAPPGPYTGLSMKGPTTGGREDNSSRAPYTRGGTICNFREPLKRGCRRENTQGGDPVRDRGDRPDVYRPFTHKAITAAVLRSRSPEGAVKNRRHRPRPYKHTRTKSDAENLRSYTAPGRKKSEMIKPP